MKKKVLIMILTIALCFGNAITVCAEGEGEMCGIYVDGKYIETPRYNDGDVMVNLQIMGEKDEVYRCYKWDKLSDKLKIDYLLSTKEPDNDALTWWVNSAYDDNTKLGYLNQADKTGTESSLWVITNQNIPIEQKVAYFRTHSFRYNSIEILQWWYENIGKKLTTAQTAHFDAENYYFYNRYMYQNDDHVEGVYVGRALYYMNIDDLNKAVAAGKITKTVRYYSCEGGPWTPYNRYDANSIDVGYKMWKISEK